MDKKVCLSHNRSKQTFLYNILCPKIYTFVLFCDMITIERKRERK